VVRVAIIPGTCCCSRDATRSAVTPIAGRTTRLVARLVVRHQPGTPEHRACNGRYGRVAYSRPPANIARLDSKNRSSLPPGTRIEKDLLGECAFQQTPFTEFIRSEAVETWILRHILAIPRLHTALITVKRPQHAPSRFAHNGRAAPVRDRRACDTRSNEASAEFPVDMRAGAEVARSTDVNRSSQSRPSIFGMPARNVQPCIRVHAHAAHRRRT